MTEQIVSNVSEDHGDSTDEIDFDDILPLAGEFGLYQVCLLVIMVPFFFMFAFLYFGQMFMTTASENFWCWVPELANFTPTQRRYLAIPDTAQPPGYSTCWMYAANWPEVIQKMKKPIGNPIIPCQNGWEFTNDIPYNTITSEYGWVCEKHGYRPYAQSLFFAGSIAGGVTIGWIADTYGRVPAATSTCILALFGGFATASAQNLLQFSIYRFISGMANDNIITMVYLLVLEYTSSKYRSVMANFPFAIFFSLATCLMPWISLWCNDWRTFTVVTSGSYLIGCFSKLFVPESPRWYLSKGRVDDAIDKLILVSKINRQPVPPALIEKFRVYQKQPHALIKTPRPTILITRPTLRKMFLLLCMLFLCTCLVFDGLIRTSDQLSLDFFMSFTLVSLTEVPSSFVVVFILERLGRRWVCIICLGISCIFSVLTALIPIGFLEITCAMIARFFVNMVYNVVMQWATELFPTSIRGIAVAGVHVFGYIGTIISPYIAHLNRYVDNLPLILLGLVGLVGSIVAIFLPETTGKDMPHTIEETEKLAREQVLRDPPMFMQNK